MVRTPRPARAAVSIAAVLLTVLAGCTGEDESSGGATTTTAAPSETTAPSTVPPNAVETGLGELEPGDCFDPIDQSDVRNLAVWKLDCAQGHTYEVYELVDYEGDGAGGSDYPGTAVVQDWSEQACYDRFEAFVGVRWTLSELDIAVWWPTEESWARGDDGVICAVVSDTGDRLTGTQRGSAR